MIFRLFNLVVERNFRIYLRLDLLILGGYVIVDLGFRKGRGKYVSLFLIVKI